MKFVGRKNSCTESRFSRAVIFFYTVKIIRYAVYSPIRAC